MEIVRKTIGQALASVVREHPIRDALIHTETGIRYGYSQLWNEIVRIAGGLVRTGIRKGDRVALRAPNIPEWIVAMLALAKMGAVIVPIDPSADQNHLQFILKQSECRGIITADVPGDDTSADMLLELTPALYQLSTVCVISGKTPPGAISWPEIRHLGEKADPEALDETEQSIRPDDAVAIMYTSGTTGNPKGVVLDHLGLINKSLCSTARQGIDRNDRLTLFFPLFHMFGNTCIALAGLLRGAALIMPCKTFEPSRILEAIFDERCTALYASPSMIISLLEHPEFEEKKWRSVHKGIVGGAPCPMDLMKRLVRHMGISDITVGYGITETSSWITMTKPQDPIHLRVSTIGTPLECNEVKIVNPSTGESLPPETQGEICTRGFLMKGYYKMPGATADAVDREGWFHSGDLGEMGGNGYVKITGRLKDTILRNGVEIYPLALEEIIYTLPEISQVQVFGFPHPEKGEEVAAWIQLREGSRISISEISAHVARHVARERAPRYYKVVAGFPMTRSGKVQKFRLAELAKKEYGTG